LETIGRKRPGDEVTVTYNRNGRTMEGRTVLKNVHGDTGIVKRSEGELSELLGARLENVNDQDLRRLSLRGGVRVSSLSSGRLAKAGVREGFVITHIDRQPVASVKELTEMLADKNGGVLVEGVYPNGTRAYYGVGL
jgi:serine protease Do